jgi:ABC-type transport system substrate-binding protein
MIRSFASMTSRVVLPLFAGGAALLLPACERPASPEPAAATPKAAAASAASPAPVAPASPKQSAARIVAEPNPVPAGEGAGRTTVSWDTGDGSVGEVWLAVDGGEEKLFGKHSKNSQDVPWISAGPTYEFRLYKGTDRQELLGSVKVTRARK